MEQTTLYYRDGSSDKVYQVGIEQKGQGYVVNFAFGRRGSTLSTGTKTQAPVSIEKAQGIFEKLVREKMAKGYSPGADGTPYQHTDKAGQHTGIHCQLLNPIDLDQVNVLLHDAACWMQEKHDGRRLLVRKDGDAIIGINRLGLEIAPSSAIVDDLRASPMDFILDGEAIGDTFHVFDALQIGVNDLRIQAYAARHQRLETLLEAFEHPNVQVVPTARESKDKAKFFQELKERNAEGVVFKQVDSRYVAGRPNTGGSQLKFKFCETASFIVGKVNGKRSVTLQLQDGSGIAEAGNVTIPPNHVVPVPGAVVEVRYLYAFRESGCVFQPVYLGAREDMDAAECVVSQLKYKG